MQSLLNSLLELERSGKSRLQMEMFCVLGLALELLGRAIQ
jgi:hypothetical protein